MQSTTGEKVYSWARCGDANALERVPDLDKWLNWRHPRNYKQTPLYTAAKYGRVSTVTLLLQRGADPFLGDEYGENPLQIAAAEGKTVVVALLAAVPNLVRSTPRAIVSACQDGKFSVVRALLSAGASPDLAVDGVTPLMAAVYGNHVDTMEVLLKADVSLEATTADGDSALHLAARYGKVEAARKLILEGASGSRKNKKNQIPLDVAEEVKSSCIHLLRNPPKLTGLPTWRPSLHHLFPVQFRHDAKNLLLLMTRLRSRDPKNFGPLWQIPNDIVKSMVFFLAELYHEK